MRSPGRAYMILGACWVGFAVGLNVLMAALETAPGWFVVPPFLAAVGAGRFWLGLRQRTEARGKWKNVEN